MERSKPRSGVDCEDGPAATGYIDGRGPNASRLVVSDDHIRRGGCSLGPPRDGDRLVGSLYDETDTGRRLGHLNAGVASGHEFGDVADHRQTGTE